MEIRVLQNYIELAFNSEGYLYCVKNYICIGMPMLIPMPMPIPRFPNGHILNEVCYLTASIAAIQFFYGSVIISRDHSKRSKCQGRILCLFHNTCSSHPYYNKWSVVDSRKFKWYAYLKKVIVAPLL